MKKILFLLFLIFVSTARCEIIDMIANFPVKPQAGYFPVKYKLPKEMGFEFQQRDLSELEHSLRTQGPIPTKVFVWNTVIDRNSPLFKLSKDRLVYFLWEPWASDFSYYSLFSRIYTWNDDLIDGVKYFKFYYPYLMQMQTPLPLFKNKKFCTLVASHWTPQRTQIIDFFDTKPKGELEYYGWTSYTPQNYCGPIPGDHSGNEKISVLKNYRFCICFENSVHLKGYITEKIFACFAAGCVPVYWGATNIEKYIPKNCYVDYRKFGSNEELYQYLKNMPRREYETYLINIRAFLNSDQAYIFSPEYFDKVLIEAIMGK